MSGLYYMRDNHTFCALSENVDEAIAQVRKEFDAGFTYGMLCTHDDVNPRYVHAMGAASWDLFALAMRQWYGIAANRVKL